MAKREARHALPYRRPGDKTGISVGINAQNGHKFADVAYPIVRRSRSPLRCGAMTYSPPPGQYPGGQPGGYPGGQPGYGAVDPATGLPYSDKSKLIAGLLGILLGGFGAGRFYTGHTGIAIGQIAATWLTCGLGALWPLIDGIMILVNGGTDAQGRPLRPN